MKAMRVVPALIFSAVVTGVAFGQAPHASAPARVSVASPRPVMTGAMQRLIVILKPAGGAAPDIASLGGRVELRLPDRMIVTVPAAAIAVIEQSPGVEYVQRSTGATVQPDLPVRHDPGPSAQEARSPVTLTGGGSQWTTGAYVYDGGGNISAIGTGTERNSDGRTNAYFYDKVGRLVQGSANYAGGDYGQVYVYDPFGNMTSVTTTKPSGPGELVFIAIDPATNQRKKLSGDPDRYDVAGNEIADPGLSTRHFDALNMMTHKNTSLTDEYYIYTPDEQRIGVLHANAAPTWTWSLRDEGGNLLRQYGSSESTPGADWLWVEDWVYGGDHLFGAERVAAQGGRRHFHLDHLGTPRLITGPGGVLYARHDYLPFGEALPESDGERDAGFDRVEPKQFTGHERDAVEQNLSATLDYVHARYYSAMLGRFISVDSSRASVDIHDPQSWNRYNYSLNNPVRYTDANGRWPTEIHNAIIDGAFQCMSKDQRNVLKAASARIDSFGHGGQTAELAYEHGMRAYWQSPAEARAMADNFIAERNHEARDILGESTNAALDLFGEGLHTVTDRTSPMHKGEQIWTGGGEPGVTSLLPGGFVAGGLIDLARAAVHSDGESHITLAQYHEAVDAARNDYIKTFGLKAFQDATGCEKVQGCEYNAIPIRDFLKHD